VISWILEILLIAVPLLIAIAYFTLAERKVLASIQRRRGPGVVGIWGTLAVGIFGGAVFLTQLIGTLSVSLAAFIFSIIVFGILKVTIGIRVSPEEEAEGLDIGEHGQEAYPDFASSSS
ncbi:MAG: NADH-quinone oxidoreductase subunit H, partial [Verrucomicrobiota bacterium]|nr:NADH-quinone oxidoreductase subunit H [Verrucomicrobiota bacterium]